METVKAMVTKGFEIDIVDPEQSGQLDPDKILSRVREDTLLVSLMHVNNETGIIQPIEKNRTIFYVKRMFYFISMPRKVAENL